MTTSLNLHAFVAESNMIEGIARDPTGAEIEAHADFLALQRISIGDLKRFVSVIQPGAVLRDNLCLNVRVGNHLAPPGGKEIIRSLAAILERANDMDDAYRVHHAYETLHPFSDGNGRSGRVLFAWMLERQGSDWLHRISFLHAWYYLSLDAGR